MQKGLKSCLEEFLFKCKELDNIDEDGEDGYQREFSQLKSHSSSIADKILQTSTRGSDPANKKKNRYRDVIPMDKSRVILTKHNGEPHSDYINASFILDPKGYRSYIASQGPLAVTVVDFWHSIVENDIKSVIMLCNEWEAGKHKCERYWPTLTEGSKMFGDVSVSLDSEATENSEFVIRHLTVSHEGRSTHVAQFHYVKWPDHGCPSSSIPLLNMLALVRMHQPQANVPVLVHCSAGCGRTGTIIAIDYIWNMLKWGMWATGNKTVYEIVLELRKQRPSMVQTKDQYWLVHSVVSQLFQKHLELMSNNRYENWVPQGKDQGSTPKKATAYAYENVVLQTLDRMLSNSEDQHTSEKALASNQYAEVNTSSTLRPLIDFGPQQKVTDEYAVVNSKAPMAEPDHTLSNFPFGPVESKQFEQGFDASQEQPLIDLTSPPAEPATKPQASLPIAIWKTNSAALNKRQMPSTADGQVNHSYPMKLTQAPGYAEGPYAGIADGDTSYLASGGAYSEVVREGGMARLVSDGAYAVIRDNDDTSLTPKSPCSVTRVPSIPMSSDGYSFVVLPTDRSPLTDNSQSDPLVMFRGEVLNYPHRVPKPKTKPTKSDGHAP